MALRSSWDGFLKFSLVSVPVRAFNAAVAGNGRVHFHMIHALCGNRVRYQKVCPVHGEVSKDEIVQGYEQEKGRYVVVRPDEVKRLRAQRDKTMTVEAFVPPAAVDPVYFSGRTYYLTPDGPAGQKPFAVLQRAMAEHERCAVARVVMTGKEELVLLRPVGKLLTMAILRYDQQVKKPSAFEDELGDAKVSAQELKLAETLVEASITPDFDLARYEDQYTGRVAELIEEKAAGKKVIGRRGEERPAVINLMDALRKSLDRTGPGRARKVGSKKGRGQRAGQAGAPQEDRLSGEV